MDEQQAANTLYGPGVSEAEPEGPTPTPNAELAARLYGKAETAPLVAGDGLHDPAVPFRAVFRQHKATLHDVFGLGEEERAVQEAQFVSLVTAMDLPYHDAARLYDLAVDAAVSADAEAYAPAGLQHRLNERDEHVRQTLRERWGEHEAQDVLARTERFIEQTHGLNELLGLGDLRARPEVMLILAEHVRRKGLR